MSANQTRMGKPPKLEPENPGVTRQREEIVNGLSKASAKASEPVLSLLKRLHETVVSTRPNSVYRQDTHQQALEAFIRIVKQMQSTGKPIEIPPIVAEANQFLTDHAGRFKANLEKAGIAVRDDPNAQARLAAVAFSVSDSNADGMSTARAKGPSIALGWVDAPLDPASIKSNDEIPAKLKGWMNPGIGNICT
jgi:hypothetical protein